MFRNKIVTLFALIFALGFDFAAYSISEGSTEGGMLGIGQLIFSLPFAVIGLLASCIVIYVPLNNLSITIAERKIKAVRRLFIFPIKMNSIQAAEIIQIEVKLTGSTGQGVKQIKHFKLIVHCRTQTANRIKKITIAEDLDGEGLANQLKDYMCKQLLINCNS